MQDRKLGDTLKEASKIINGERQDSYGAPEDSFALIAEFWSSYLKGVKGALNAKDVGDMLLLFKMARTQGAKPSRDTYVDIAGYASIIGDRLMKEWG